MSVVVVVGAQWGDEGKGKITDLLSLEAEVVVRFGGGANAGHTLVVNGQKTVIRLVPSGILHPHTQCILGHGMVIDAEVLRAEIAQLKERGVNVDGRLLVSDGAHLVLDVHRTVDACRESGPNPIGTTKKGIGPAYEDKVGRRGVRVGHLFSSGLDQKLDAMAQYWNLQLAPHQTQCSPDALKAECARAADVLKPYVTDTSLSLDALRRQGKKILLEGAQGTWLDIDHGTYPFVTSSNTTSSGASIGSGIPPHRINRVIGITKAYSTRVGEGPFPTEDHGDAGERLRQAGHEFGSVTGRPRRCGWLDLAMLRDAVRLNGMDVLAVTKLDVLSGFDQIQVGVGTKNGETVYQTLDGWQDDITGARSLEALPANCRSLISKIEAFCDVPVSIVSVGPGRDQTIIRSRTFS